MKNQNQDYINYSKSLPTNNQLNSPQRISGQIKIYQKFRQTRKGKRKYYQNYNKLNPILFASPHYRYSTQHQQKQYKPQPQQNKHIKTQQSLKKNQKIQILRNKQIKINPQDINIQKYSECHKTNKSVQCSQISKNSTPSIYKRSPINTISPNSQRKQFKTDLTNNYPYQNKFYGDPQHIIQQAQRQYFHVLQQPRNFKLPKLENSMFMPRPSQFISEYKNSFGKQIIPKRVQNLQQNMQYGLRQQLRKINPTFTSSLKNPLSSDPMQHLSVFTSLNKDNF